MWFIHVCILHKPPSGPPYICCGLSVTFHSSCRAPCLTASVCMERSVSRIRFRCWRLYLPVVCMFVSSCEMSLAMLIAYKFPFPKFLVCLSLPLSPFLMCHSYTTFSDFQCVKYAISCNVFAVCKYITMIIQ